MVISANSVSFKASANEIKSLENICKNLSKNLDNSCYEESFDIAEINGKAHILYSNKDNKASIDMKVTNQNGTNASTYVYMGKPNKLKEFLSNKLNILTFESTLDWLKDAIAKAEAKEAWTD